MVEVIDETKQKKLDRLLSLLDPENALSKTDFIKSFEQVVNLVVQIQQKQAKAIDDLERTYAQLLDKMNNDHSSHYQELKGQVNDLFVRNQLKRIDGETKANFEKRQKEMNEMIDKKLQEADDYVYKLQPLKGDKGDRGDIGPMPTEHLELMKGMITEMKKIQNILSNVPRGGTGRAKVPMPRTIDLTSSQDGQARVFNIPPDTVRIFGGLSSQFPFAISSSDISRSGNQITLDSTIAPRQTGQTLLIFTDALFYP